MYLSWGWIIFWIVIIGSLGYESARKEAYREGYERGLASNDRDD